MEAKRTKKYIDWKNKNHSNDFFKLSDALKILKENPLEKFNSTLNLSFCLNLDHKKPAHNLKGSFLLPFATPSKMKIVVFSTKDPEEIFATKADVIGGTELIDEIARTKKINFDVVLATPEIMPKMNKIASILGPKKIMPTSKKGTVSLKLGKIIENFKKGQRFFGTDGKNSIIFVLGKLSNSLEELTENFKYLINKVNNIRPDNLKGKYLKAIYLSGTMTPSFKIILEK